MTSLKNPYISCKYRIKAFGNQSKSNLVDANWIHNLQGLPEDTYEKILLEALEKQTLILLKGLFSSCLKNVSWPLLR